MDENQKPVNENAEATSEPIETAEELIEQGTTAAAEAATTLEAASVTDEASTTHDTSSAFAAAPGSTGEQRSVRITDHLAEDTEYDPEANNDDKLLAAVAYASQLIIPVLVPVILLVSETSKKRSFQRYHAVQSLAAGLAIWALQLGLGTLAGIAAASLIGLLCLCFILPAMIVLWLLPLYYAILAYSGKRFRIPGLTQFLQDQGWL